MYSSAMQVDGSVVGCDEIGFSAFACMSISHACLGEDRCRLGIRDFCPKIVSVFQ